ncbi:hypothetical protein Bca4012_088834 [Brassica carinata]
MVDDAVNPDSNSGSFFIPSDSIPEAPSLFSLSLGESKPAEFLADVLYDQSCPVMELLTSSWEFLLSRESNTSKCGPPLCIVLNGKSRAELLQTLSDANAELSRKRGTQTLAVTSQMMYENRGLSGRWQRKLAVVV